MEACQEICCFDCFVTLSKKHLINWQLPFSNVEGHKNDSELWWINGSRISGLVQYYPTDIQEFSIQSRLPWAKDDGFLNWSVAQISIQSNRFHGKLIWNRWLRFNGIVFYFVWRFICEDKIFRFELSLYNCRSINWLQRIPLIHQLAISNSKYVTFVQM